MVRVMAVACLQAQGFAKPYLERLADALRHAGVPSHPHRAQPLLLPLLQRGVQGLQISGVPAHDMQAHSLQDPPVAQQNESGLSCMHAHWTATLCPRMC